jgi:hypothetical protein
MTDVGLGGLFPPAAKKVWAVALTQVHLMATLYMAGGIGVSGLSLGLIIGALWYRRTINKQEIAPFHADTMLLANNLCILAGMVCMIFGMSYIARAVPMMINPDWYAIRMILHP